jgi:hypothetical protein
MSARQIPLHIEGIHENLYAGFWPRLGSILLDGGKSYCEQAIHR